MSRVAVGTNFTYRKLAPSRVVPPRTPFLRCVRRRENARREKMGRRSSSTLARPSAPASPLFPRSCSCDSHHRPLDIVLITITTIRDYQSLPMFSHAYRSIDAVSFQPPPTKRHEAASYPNLISSTRAHGGPRGRSSYADTARQHFRRASGHHQMSPLPTIFRVHTLSPWASSNGRVASVWRRLRRSEIPFIARCGQAFKRSMRRAKRDIVVANNSPWCPIVQPLTCDEAVTATLVQQEAWRGKQLHEGVTRLLHRPGYHRC